MRQSDFDAFKKCVIFNGLSDAQVKDIAEHEISAVKAFKKHDVIFSPDNYSDSLAIITKGKADVYKHTDSGELFLSILNPGNVFGMAGLFFEADGFINTVSAREDCRAAFITKKSLEGIFVKYPVTVHNYITVLSQKIHYLNTKIANLTSPSPSSRLMAYLDSLDKDGDGKVLVPMSFSELSRVLALGRTSLYNAFDELTEKGRIIRTGKTIQIILPKGNNNDEI